MKILIAHHLFSEYGGGEKIIYSEAKLLEKMGHQVYFFATNKQPYLLKDYQYAKYFPNYIDFKNLSLFQSPGNLLKSFYNLEAQKLFAAYIDEIHPELIHCHNIFYYLTPSLLDEAYKRGIPVVMTLHDPRIVCPAATLRIKDSYYCFNELCISGNPLHCLLNKCKYGRLIPSTIVSMDYLFWRMFKYIDKIAFFICPSAALKNLLVRNGISADKIAVINNFVDDSILNNEPCYTNNNYFLYAGRLLNIKGVDLVIKAMKTVSETHLYIAGTGPEENKLKNLVNDLNLNNVVFLEYKTGKDLEDLYRNCIATILASNWFENFPVALIESFAYGKPVIASDTGGISEMVCNQENGLLFDMGNIEALSEAIKILSSNHKLAITLGKNAKQMALEKYNSCKHYNDLFKVYNKVLNP